MTACRNTTTYINEGWWECADIMLFWYNGINGSRRHYATAVINRMSIMTSNWDISVTFRTHRSVRRRTTTGGISNKIKTRMNWRPVSQSRTPYVPQTDNVNFSSAHNLSSRSRHLLVINRFPFPFSERTLSFFIKTLFSIRIARNESERCRSSLRKDITTQCMIQWDLYTKSMADTC